MAYWLGLFPIGFIWFVLVCLLIAGFLVLAANYRRDSEVRALESGALWNAVSFQEISAEDGELFLILPNYRLKNAQFLIQDSRHELCGTLQKGKENVELNLFGKTWLISLPGRDTGDKEINRSFGDSILFWEDGLVAGEVLPIGLGRKDQYSVVTNGREYEVVIPKGSERLIGKAMIDGEVVAEFARADKLSMGRARLLAFRGADREHLLPMLCWIAVNRA